MLKMKGSSLFLLIASSISRLSYGDTTSADKPSEDGIQQLSPGYNASASYKGPNSCGLFFTANYIYWNWQQDSLLMGSWVNVSNGGSSSIFQNPGYASGFQLGAGFEMPEIDHWNLYSEYTWYKNSVATSITTGSNYLLQKKGQKNTFFQLDGNATSSLSFKLDVLDLVLQRPFYLGTKLTADFSMGLEALWMTQNVTKSGNGFRKNPSEPLFSPYTCFFTQHLTNWGLGPKFGLETNWNLGLGINIIANFSSSILYTRYNLNSSISQNKIIDSDNITVNAKNNDLENYNVLRPITEAFLGLGWNTGISHNRFHITVSAGYDFNVYWNYDMLNYITFNSKSDIYLQGMNIKIMFTF